MEIYRIATIDFSKNSHMQCRVMFVLCSFHIWNWKFSRLRRNAFHWNCQLVTAMGILERSPICRLRDSSVGQVIHTVKLSLQTSGCSYHIYYKSYIYLFQGCTAYKVFLYSADIKNAAPTQTRRKKDALLRHVEQSLLSILEMSTKWTWLQSPNCKHSSRSLHYLSRKYCTTKAAVSVYNPKWATCLLHQVAAFGSNKKQSTTPKSESNYFWRDCGPACTRGDAHFLPANTSHNGNGVSCVFCPAAAGGMDTRQGARTTPPINHSRPPQKGRSRPLRLERSMTYASPDHSFTDRAQRDTEIAAEYNWSWQILLERQNDESRHLIIYFHRSLCSTPDWLRFWEKHLAHQKQLIIGMNLLNAFCLSWFTDGFILISA